MDKQPERKHLTTDDLILFMDRELDQQAATEVERHLWNCVECGRRLQALQRGSASHDEYHARILKPALEMPEGDWAPIGHRLQGLKRRGSRSWKWTWAAAALAASLVCVWFYLPMFRTAGEPSAQEVLEKAERAPEAAQGDIVLTTGKLHWARPAVLETGASEVHFQHVEALFVEANYSWRNPLSARSFAAWRKQLPDKRDFVTTIHQDGGRPSYRIRTRTDAGVLHSASLMLDEASYHPSRASFEFQGEDLIEISEQSDLPMNNRQEAQSAPAETQPKVTETVASPEDELRVFAALDALGADAEEPIEVRLDLEHRHILVTGMGMPAQRRKQIETALASLPNTVVRFSSGQALAERAERAETAAANTQDESETGHSSFLHELQDRVGGARQLQTITDESLETSNGLFAQSHALLVLAKEFPPAIEQSLTPAGARTLLSLRQRRLGAITYAIRRLRNQMKPLVGDGAPITSSVTNASWQSEAEGLYESIRNLDRLLSRLLAGSYEDQLGEQMLRQLPVDLATVEAQVLADSR